MNLINKMVFTKGHPGYLKKHSNDTKRRISQTKQNKRDEISLKSKEMWKTRSKDTLKNWLKGSKKSQFKKGIVPWNKGTSFRHEIRTCLKCGKKYNPVIQLQKCCLKGCATSLRQTGRKYSEETKQKMSLSKTKEKIFTGYKHKLRHTIMMSKKYKEWRQQILSRDNFTCQTCRSVGGSLEVHHIKSFARFKELRLDINNGITLCRQCHTECDKYRKMFAEKRQEQWLE